MNWRFDNSYARLPAMLYARLPPITVRSPSLIMFNRRLSTYLGLDDSEFNAKEIAAILSGNKIAAGSEPIAQAYAGHQFGHFTVLGDGRAILLGEHILANGQRCDIQLKGSGKTPFSRGGDGRATLGPMLREYIISEAMWALGIPSTRSLAVVATGENVQRDTILPGAILTRVAASHIRIGTFQYIATQGNLELLRTFADYTIQRHYPEHIATANTYLQLLYSVMDQQAKLVAQWMGVGFIHGVMNTDNMTISGETIDYGPCAFMDAYNPDTVFSSIDVHGRYAYKNQPSVAQWNLARFAETLLPLLHRDINESVALATSAIEAFPQQFLTYWLGIMRAKLGLFDEKPTDTVLINDLLKWMQEKPADYTNTFRALALDSTPDDAIDDENFKNWHQRWLARFAEQPEPLPQKLQLMQANNPAVIPRNHRVEEALEAAVEQGDLSLMRKLLDVLSEPYVDISTFDDYRKPAIPGNCIYQTFCGT